MLKRYLAPVWACLAIVATSLLSAPALQAETDPKQYAVEVSATVQSSPAQINLSWVADSNATGYTLYRKSLASSSWSQVASLGGSATSWTDSNVSVGSAFEYRIDKRTNPGYAGFGYIYAGINAPMTDSRGTVLLIVDNTHAAALDSELARLQQDFIGDGWTVVRKDFARTDSVATVKNYIRNAHAADPNNVKAVFLFGHIAVPYSGNYAPDGHEPDHVGAWPADAYYGDVNGTWTDSSVSNSGAHRAANHNQPGDGKFDQNQFPSDIDLYVGRVDLYNMTCYANKTPSRSELDLLRQYLNKDHNFRHKKFNLDRSGVIMDNFGETGGEAFAASGWRSFAPMFGADKVTKIAPYTFFPTLNNEAHLWAYGTGGGSYYGCNGVGNSDEFATGDIKAVFTMFLGSYYGDWDNESNFLRAPLGGTSYTLTSVWGGRPHWFFHHMALGEPIGYSAKVTQNNSSTYLNNMNWCSRDVHTALLGDPTLRLHPVAPVGNVSGSLNGATATVTWTASPDTDLVGYHVYKSAPPTGSFQRLTSSPVNALSFTDSSSAAGVTYMVRAVKLEKGGSGTYFNPSQGIFYTLGTSGGGSTGGGTVAVPPAPSTGKAVAVSPTQINLTWKDNSNNEEGFAIEKRWGALGAWVAAGEAAADATSFAATGLTSGGTWHFRVRAFNSGGYSAFSPSFYATTPLPPKPTAGTTATFVRSDTTTRGSWKNAYGAEGAQVFGDAVKPFTYGSVTPVLGVLNHTWNWTTSDPRALTRVATSDRVAACWYSPTTFTFDVQVTGSTARTLSLYFMDWDFGGRSQTVEILDATTGALLNKQTVSNFSQGVYLSWNVTGKVRVRLTALLSNTVISGVFMGGASASVAEPTPTPTPTPSATTAARFVSADTTTKGTWKGIYGSEGYNVAGDSAASPAYATVSTTGAAAWTWNYTTSDSRALQKATQADRIAACWYTTGSMTINVNLNDGKTHRIGGYFLDWDYAGRSQKVELVDAATGTVLDSRTVSAFSGGQHLLWDVKGNVKIRVTNLTAGNAVMNGLFFMPTTTQL